MIVDYLGVDHRGLLSHAWICASCGFVGKPGLSHHEIIEAAHDHQYDHKLGDALMALSNFMIWVAMEAHVQDQIPKCDHDIDVLRAWQFAALCLSENRVKLEYVR